LAGEDALILNESNEIIVTDLSSPNNDEFLQDWYSGLIRSEFHECKSLQRI
jgi:hypothetical protein